MSSLTITLIQPNLHWEDKKANLTMLSEKIEGIKEKTEVIVGFLTKLTVFMVGLMPKKLTEKIGSKFYK